MARVYKNLILLIFLILPITSKAHVQHYDNLNLIKFDILRNNKHIGTHIFSFERTNNQLFVKRDLSFLFVGLNV